MNDIIQTALEQVNSMNRSEAVQKATQAIRAIANQQAIIAQATVEITKLKEVLKTISSTPITQEEIAF